jgi:tRNA(Met) cytidine acetyltransferase
MEHARRLAAEASAADERRLLVLSGSPDATRERATAALSAAGVDPAATTVLTPENADVPGERVDPSRAGELLGTTRECVVYDAHEALVPNAIGRSVGAVDGGGLYVLLAPPLDAWPDRRDGFDERLAVPPFGVDDVTGNFRRRFVDTLRAHRGVSVVDADERRVRSDGRVDPPPREPPSPPEAPDDRAFPRETYEACLTADQSEAVRACEALRGEGVVVLESDRGRGKSSACGLAAGALAAAGRDVVVTGPEYRATAEVFARAEELLDALGALGGTGDREVRADDGRVRYVPAPDAAEAEGDVLVVDEAAALPVDLLAATLAAGVPVAYATTVHGYEGAGRGFSVRFRDRLDESGRDVVETSLTDPIRYAPGDPVETWAFRALLLDARPPVDDLVARARPGTVTYEAPSGVDLSSDDHLLREAFGLLVLAHYRTEPDDLARLLDAPNVAVRALRHDGHVAAIALLAREGDLSAGTRRSMYEGSRVRGNMLPDVLTSQLRDEAAGVPTGLRVLRIATHNAVRSRGLGSHLLDRVRAEFAGDVDYLGVGYGATPDLLDFWRTNGYRTVHLSLSRNDRSGDHSALMVTPLSETGADLHDRTAAFFARRIGSVLADALDDADPDVVRAALRATDATVPLDLTDREWRLVAAAAYGPGLSDVAPRPFRRLALRHLVEREADLSADQERLLVRKLQAWGWSDVAEDLGYVSRREATLAFGDALKPLVEASGNDAAREEADRYR